MNTQVRIGCQGWQHLLHPAGRLDRASAPTNPLGEYARKLATVEIHSTFLGVPPTCVVREWHDAVPQSFTFALKVPHDVSHVHRFVQAGSILDRFLDRICLLDRKLGPLLIQMGLAFRATNSNRQVLADFLRALPKGFSWALEARRSEWLTEGFIRDLSASGVALALVLGRWIRQPTVFDLAARPTAEFAYIRWSAAVAQRNGGLGRPSQWSHWTAALRRLQGRVPTVYGYFDPRVSGESLDQLQQLERVVNQSITPG